MTPQEGRWPRFRRVFRLPFTRARIDAALRDEFRFHIQERVEQLVRSGMSPAAAEAEVARRFGNYEAYREQARQIDEETMRQRTLLETVETLRRETALAARVLLRTPAFSIIAFITLALGIGATTSMFTVLDAVVLRPLPYAHSDRLVSILHPVSVPGNGDRKWGMSPGGYFFMKKNNRSFTDLGIYRTGSVTITGGPSAEVARAGTVTSSLFTVFGARPYLGRLFDVTDDRVDSPSAVLLSYEFWERRYGGDRSIIGKSIEVDGQVTPVVGVTEPGLTLPMPGPFAAIANIAGFGVDVWRPYKLNPAGPFYNNHPNVGVARLKPGVTVEDANREVAALTRRLPDAVPNAYKVAFMNSFKFRGEATPLKDAVLGPTVPRALWALFGSVVIVLLIAVANVANLFIVRMDSRRRESTIRTALGADRVHMATHYLSESLLLCGVAAIAGVAIAAGGLRAMIAVAPTTIPRLQSVAFSWQSVVFALALAPIIGTIFGLIPMIRRGLDLSTLREGGRGLSISKRQRAFRGALVVSQMALALVLLSSAGLMIRSFMHLRAVDPGFDGRNVVAFDVALPYPEYDTPDKAAAFYRQLQERFTALPGVTNVGGATSAPLEGYATGCSSIFREGRPYATGEEPPCVTGATISPGFFEALRIRVDGHSPTWGDFDSRTQATVVTRALADRLWPGENPIGKGVAGYPGTSVWYRVTGVIPDLRAEAFDRPAIEAVFYPGTSLVERKTDNFNYLTIMVRASGTPAATLIPTLRRIMAEMNPRVPFQSPRTMDMIVERSMARTSFVMILLGVSAMFALLLSAVGIYGVISYVVTQRRFEIGVRIALGARVAEVARLVVMQSVALAAAGVVIGIAGAYAVTSVIKSMLFNVSPMDPLVLTIVALTLVAIATLASFAPARRAARIDPVEALRAD